jgi:NADPH:quinone reductase-like Zn-dependent oxidoreductase
MEYVRQLGADEVIDYKKQRFEEVVRDVDIVLDTIGGETQQRSWQTLRARGILVSTVQPTANLQGRRGLFFRCDHARSDQLGQIASLVVSGEVKVHIEGRLPLAEARRAQELSQAGHIQGKIVLKIA